MQRGTFQLMKSVNKSLILNKIRKNGPISRAQIAKDSKLTPPTVSSIVKELLDQGIVKESSLGESLGGRKPTMLRINADQFFVIGVDISPDTIECALTNISKRILKRKTNKLRKGISNTQFLKVMKMTITSLLETVTAKDRILGIGVAMHGAVETATGTSLIAPLLGLQNIPIKKELEKEFGLMVKVENDARAMALGESWFGNYGEQNSMIAVNIGNGVGSGLIVNGKLYHGSQGIAGEIGHMTIDLKGDMCECGNKGCLQTFVSGPSITKRANHLEIGTFYNGEEVYKAAIEGNVSIANLLRETGTIIGIGLTNLIHVINPELIVLGGGVVKAHRFLLPEINQTIEERGLTRAAKETTVVISELGNDATLFGAIALVLVELFK